MANRGRSFVSKDEYITGLSAVAFSGGDLVYKDNTGRLQKAGYSTTLAQGIILDDVPANVMCTAYRAAVLTDYSGLTPGTRYALDVNGGITNLGTPAGFVRQIVGLAISTTEIRFDIEPSALLIQTAGNSILSVV